MSLVQRVKDNLRQKRDNVLEGNVNCILSPLVSFRDDFIGIEQETYYLISGGPKTGKSKFASFIFLYNAVLYAYHNPEKLRLKIFYVNLEETKEKITERFMVYLLYELSGRKVRTSQKELESVCNPVDERMLELLDSREYSDILDFYEKHVEFLESTNPTGIFKSLVDYAAHHGKRIMKKVPMKNSKGEQVTVEKFDRYEPDDPNEYVEIIIDHISLITTENGLDLRSSIKKLSSYLVELRNKYRYIPVVIQQQSTETSSLEAYKNMKIRPTVAGLADCKDTAKDLNVMLGLSNPYAFEIKTYFGYDISRLHNCQRFLECVLNRDGSASSVKALYFDGAVSFFSELPSPKDSSYSDYMARIYSYIASVENGDYREKITSSYLDKAVHE